MILLSLALLNSCDSYGRLVKLDLPPPRAVTELNRLELTCQKFECKKPDCMQYDQQYFLDARSWGLLVIRDAERDAVENDLRATILSTH